MEYLSIVIPALNAAETIRANLSSLLNNDFPKDCFEILVACDGSTDGTPQIAASFPVNIVECHKKGIGAARNLGASKAKYDVVCFVDSDCVVSSTYLKKISDYFEAHPEVDGVGGPVLPLIYKGINDWSVFIEEIYAEACDFPTEEVTVRSREEVGVHNLAGPNMALRKSALVSVGGFEERMLGEAVDLCWRLVDAGKVLRFLPDLKVFHYIAGDLQRIFRHSFSWGVEAMALRRKYPKNLRIKEKPLFVFSIESLKALLRVASVLRSIASRKPLYGNRKKAFLRAYMLCAFYIGYFHAPKNLAHHGELGLVNMQKSKNNFSLEMMPKIVSKCSRQQKV